MNPTAIRRAAISATATSIFCSTSSTAPSVDSPFNVRGVIGKPIFKLRRATPAKGQIEFTVEAHPVGEGQWIAQPAWICREGRIPMDALPLDEISPRFATRSEAVDEAMRVGMRQVRAQTSTGIDQATWDDRVESLRGWMSEAIARVRAKDEALPLRSATVADIFAGGSGGFALGLASLGATVTLACEIDKEALAVYKRNVHPKAVHGDIRTLDASKISVDIVTMGLLCQAFSPAGKHRGFADPVLADVYRHAMRVLSEIDAKVIVIECARQLMTQGGGKNADQLVATLTTAGYRVQHRTLNASGFGVAQSRERSFIVATRRGLAVDDILGFMFPEQREPTATVGDIMDPGLAATVPAKDIVALPAKPSGRQPGMVEVGRIDGRNSQGYRVYSTAGVGATLTTSGGGRARYSGAYAVAGGARALTPREACRMQGIPEWAVHHEVAKRAMGHAGNAVAVPVARELGRCLADALRRAA